MRFKDMFLYDLRTGIKNTACYALGITAFSYVMVALFAVIWGGGSSSGIVPTMILLAVIAPIYLNIDSMYRVGTANSISRKTVLLSLFVGAVVIILMCAAVSFTFEKLAGPLFAKMDVEYKVSIFYEMFTGKKAGAPLALLYQCVPYFAEVFAIYEFYTINALLPPKRRTIFLILLWVVYMVIVINLTQIVDFIKKTTGVDLASREGMFTVIVAIASICMLVFLLLFRRLQFTSSNAKSAN